jgi:ankyrin repeat protein
LQLIGRLAAVVAEVGKAANPQTDHALRGAIAKGDIKAVKQQLSAGADVNVKAARGWTPLHNAVDSDDKEIVELLVKNGADVNATHNGGGTPLHWAARKGYKQIVELLIANGAKCECSG